MRIDIFAQAEMNDEAQHQAERFSMKNMQKLKIKKEHAKACSFFCRKLLSYDSNENFSSNIMMQLDCDVEFTSVAKRTIWQTNFCAVYS